MSKKLKVDDTQDDDENSKQNQSSSSSSSSNSLPDTAVKPRENGISNLNPATESLGISLVLDKIFNNLNNNDRKQFSFINKTWSNAAAHTLGRQFKLTIGSYEPGEKTILLKFEEKIGVNSKKVSTYVDSFEEIEEQLKSAPKKRLSIILLFSNYEDEKIINFFQNTTQPSSSSSSSSSSSAITQLTVVDFRAASWPKIVANVISKLPNLEYLHLDVTSRERNVGHRTPFGSLYKVTTLRFGPSHCLKATFICDILKSLPNVENMLDFPIHCLEAVLVHPGIESKIKSLVYEDKDIQSKTKWTNTPFSFKLRSFKISLIRSSASVYHPNLWKECCTWFSNVLKSSSHSLTKLELEPHDFSQSVLEFPAALPSLSTLVLRDPWHLADEKQRYFPQGFDSDRTLPHLTIVEILDLPAIKKGLADLLPVDVFHPGISFDGVRLLRLRDVYGFSIDGLSKIATIFPHITSLQVEENPIWLKLLSTVWCLWPDLEDIKLEVTMDTGLWDLGEFGLDQIFTGIPDTQCQKLRMSKSKPEMDKLAECPAGSAISSMTNLKSLTIIFKSGYKKMPIISQLSFLYGFQLVPQLTVRFGVPARSSQEYRDKIKTMLQPILPFVTFTADHC